MFFTEFHFQIAMHFLYAEVGVTRRGKENNFLGVPDFISFFAGMFKTKGVNESW